MKKALPIFCFSLLTASIAFAQPVLKTLEANLGKETHGNAPSGSLSISATNNNIGTLWLNQGQPLLMQDAANWLLPKLGGRSGIDEWRKLPTSLQLTDMQVDLYQQYFKGIKVEDGLVKVGGTNGFARLLQMEVYSVKADQLLQPVLSEQTALQKAMDFSGCRQFAWAINNGGQNQPPSGELVILMDDAQTPKTLVLAYKFLIRGTMPYVSGDVYVDASNGKILAARSRIKKYGKDDPKTKSATDPSHSLQHQEPSRGAANATGTAATRFSGTRSLITDGTGSAFRLQQTTSYGVPIVTLNYQKRPYSDPNSLLAVDFTDNDNNWTAAEISNANLDDIGTQVHFNMQVVADYWKDKQGRNSWNNQTGAAGTIKSFIHVGDPGSATPVVYNNASWDGSSSAIVYGDGQNGAFASFDISAHELGHAVSAGLMTHFTGSRESGALDEGFSDIWAACATHYANTSSNTNYNNVGDDWIRGGLTSEKRRMDLPKEYECPDTYYGQFFIDATANGCASPAFQDACGIHTNCGVLSKWFYLITNGGSGTNDNGYTYSVTGLGFDVAEKIAFFTEALLTGNADFKAVMNTSINYVYFKYGQSSNEAAQVTAAWRAVGVLNFTQFNAANTPVFSLTTDLFTTVAVAKNGYVWAGTSGKGLFRYDGKNWKKYSNALGDSVTVNRVNYRDMKVDKKGGLFIAQTGYSGVVGVTNSSGGIYYFRDTSFSTRKFYTTSINTNPLKRNVLTRNVPSIWVDTSRNNSVATSRGLTLPQVWAACIPHTTSSTTISGGVCLGLTDTINNTPNCCTTIAYDSNFLKVTTTYMHMVDVKTSFRGAQTIGGDGTEVWAYMDRNTESSSISWGYGTSFTYTGTPCQIMRYNAATGDSIGVYNVYNIPQFDTNFLAKAIYFDLYGNKWVGLQTKGIVVMDANGAWHKSTAFTDNYTPEQLLSVPDIFPANTIVNNNAIVGDDSGRVFIGTNNGLIVYNGWDIDRLESYTRYSTADGLPFNNIRAIAYDKERAGLWLASDAGGIAFWGGLDRNIIASNVKISCPGNLMGYALNVRGHYFDSPTPNKIIVELSDASGSFASPTVLEQITTNYQYVPGAPRRLVQIPFSVPTGSGYRIRAKSTNPVVTSESSAPFSIIQNNFIPASGAINRIANRECTDPQGWTHYFFDNNTPNNEVDDVRLLSIKKNGNYIGAIGDGGFSVIGATTSGAGSSTGVSVSNPIITNPIVSMNRYWQVVPNAQPTSPVGVRFYYTSQDLVDINGTILYGPINHQQLVFFKTNGNPNPTSNLASTTNLISYVNGAAPGLSTWTYTPLGSDVHQAEFLVSGFSGGSGGSTVNDGPLTGPLPLQLTSFQARISQQQSLLSWQTSNEFNTAFFDIERSLDGINFSTMIGRVTAAGNSNAPRSYSLTDAQPVRGNNYYRLKMVDQDGRFTYSPVKMLYFGGNGLAITVYPNPTKDVLNIETNLTGATAKLLITDVTGRVYRQQQISIAPVMQVSLANLATGTYVLQLNNGQSVITSKIEKRK